MFPEASLRFVRHRFVHVLSSARQSPRHLEAGEGQKQKPDVEKKHREASVVVPVTTVLPLNFWKLWMWTIENFEFTWVWGCRWVHRETVRGWETRRRKRTEEEGFPREEQVPRTVPRGIAGKSNPQRAAQNLDPRAAQTKTAPEQCALPTVPLSDLHRF